MIGSAVLLAFLIEFVIFLVLMDRLKFLIPFKYLLFHTYASDIGMYALLTFINLFALIFVLYRRFFLKHAGQKLVHLDKELKTSQSALSQEIAERFPEE